MSWRPWIEAQLAQHCQALLSGPGRGGRRDGQVLELATVCQVLTWECP